MIDEPWRAVNIMNRIIGPQFPPESVRACRLSSITHRSHGDLTLLISHAVAHPVTGFQLFTDCLHFVLTQNTLLS